MLFHASKVQDIYVKWPSDKPFFKGSKQLLTRIINLKDEIEEIEDKIVPSCRYCKGSDCDSYILHGAHMNRPHELVYELRHLSCDRHEKCGGYY